VRVHGMTQVEAARVLGVPLTLKRGLNCARGTSRSNSPTFARATERPTRRRRPPGGRFTGTGSPDTREVWEPSDGR
jgi:hypothetical protein